MDQHRKIVIHQLSNQFLFAFCLLYLINRYGLLLINKYLKIIKQKIKTIKNYDFLLYNLGNFLLVE